MKQEQSVEDNKVQSHTLHLGSRKEAAHSQARMIEFTGDESETKAIKYFTNWRWVNHQLGYIVWFAYLEYPSGVKIKLDPGNSYFNQTPIELIKEIRIHI